MRVIAKLDIKNEFVIKGIQFDGQRKIGDPKELCKKYYEDDADELILYDSVASLYGRNNLFSLIEKITENIFIPVCVGGGIRTLDDIKKALNAGADKVAINTAIVKNPNFLKEATQVFGVSNIVAYIEAKKINNDWGVYINNGRENSGLNLGAWIEKILSIGCGEILLASVDSEGTQKGFDLNLMDYLLKKKINTPLIFSGGCGNSNHIELIHKHLYNDAIALSSCLHYNKVSIAEIKKKLIL